MKDPDLFLRRSNEIQGNILAGFRKDHQAFLFLKFPDDAVQTRAWLKELLPRVSTTREVAEFNDRFSRARHQRGGDDPEKLKAKWVNLGITFPGLRKLDPAVEGDLGTSAGTGFRAFVEGPAARAAQLGDVDFSDPTRWILGGPQQEVVDAVLTVAADDPDHLTVELEKLRALASKCGLVTVFEQRGETLPGERAGHEHFGFKDGISQPGVRGFDEPDEDDPNEAKGRPGSDLIFPGEFVLGYERQGPETEGEESPLSEPARPHPGWMRDGSFQVFRRLSQDVPGFWAQVTAHVHSLPSDDPMKEDLLAAKLVGRWRSGTPLAEAPENDDRSRRNPGQDNDFSFDDDPKGLKCPRFAHIRKMYPRNDQVFRDGQRRILRRGIPYGLPFDPTNGRGHGVDADRGLVFMAFMADIEDQFEFLQRSWANLRSFPGVALKDGVEDGPDPIIGDTKPRPAPILLQRQDRADTKLEFSRFVHTTGAVYAFAPSLSTLQSLGSGASLAQAAGASSSVMNVVVKSGTAAEAAYVTPSGELRNPATGESLVVGVSPAPDQNLIFRGGKTIPTLTYTNFYVGGATAWKTSDIQKIDHAMETAMLDARLNEVLAQYFPGGAVKSVFRPSSTLPGTAPRTVSRGDITHLVRSVRDAGKLNGFDLRTTVFDFLLPAGTVLTTASGPTGSGADTEEPRLRSRQRIVRSDVHREADSLHGLGGYHGSVVLGGDTIYFAVAVLSQRLPDGAENGIVAFNEPWKNIVATFYHELCEVRTDPDVEEANSTGQSDLLGWTSRRGQEIGDFPISIDPGLTKVFKEIPLADGSGTVPIQFPYSNRVAGPEDPTKA